MEREQKNFKTSFLAEVKRENQSPPQRILDLNKTSSRAFENSHLGENKTL